MILRLSQKLNARIKGGTLAVLARHENPLFDWSAHVFAVERAEYVLLSNTTSLYSAVLDDTGLRDATRFTDRVLSVIRTVLEGAGADRVATQARESAQFAKSLGRSVTGSMNELIAHAVAFLADGDLPLADVGVRLNDILLSALGGGSNKYGRLREVFAALVAPRRAGRHSGEES